MNRKDDFVKSLNNLSFRVKREIFSLQHVKSIRFLPMVEMTHSLSLTLYETIKKNQHKNLAIYPDCACTVLQPDIPEVPYEHVDINQGFG